MRGPVDTLNKNNLNRPASASQQQIQKIFTEKCVAVGEGGDGLFADLSQAMDLVATYPDSRGAPCYNSSSLKQIRLRHAGIFISWRPSLLFVRRPNCRRASMTYVDDGDAMSYKKAS